MLSTISIVVILQLYLFFDKVNSERGYYTTLGCITDNNCRIQNAQRQSSDIAKTRRRYLVDKKKAEVAIHIRLNVKFTLLVILKDA